MKLKDLAVTIRSKNASPFITTLDVFFDDVKKYEHVRNSNVITKSNIAKLYNIPEESIFGIWFVDLCNGIKISFLKPRAADDIDGTDVYGAQQNAPLIDLEIP
ncbi:MAG TPA: DUF4387 domain-containing protein [Thermoanaerobacterales bacterium]|nr:DUF4387 domain-containing protein [Thermoanaerobacterales bacterium]